MGRRRVGKGKIGGEEEEEEKALPLLGMFIGTIATEEYSHTTKVYVAQGSYGTLMSHQTAEKLSL